MPTPGPCSALRASARPAPPKSRAKRAQGGGLLASVIRGVDGTVVFPYLIGEDLLARPHGQPTRWVIDFNPKDQLEAQQYGLPW